MGTGSMTKTKAPETPDVTRRRVGNRFDEALRWQAGEDRDEAEFDRESLSREFATSLDEHEKATLEVNDQELGAIVEALWPHLVDGRMRAQIRSVSSMTDAHLDAHVAAKVAEKRLAVRRVLATLKAVRRG